MLLVASLALLSAPLQIDWNGEPLGKGLERLGPQIGERLRTDTSLSQEPVFALVADADPKEFLARIAEVMVASWQRESDGGLRLVRLPEDRRRVQEMRQVDTERRYGESIAAYVMDADLANVATDAGMSERMKKLRTLADGKAPDRFAQERSLTAGLASGRLLARCLVAVGIGGLSRIPAEGRVVFSSKPTPRQAAIPSAEAILRAFRTEHPIFVGAYERIGSIGGASDGRPNTVDDLSGVPVHLRLEASRESASEDLSVSVTVFAADGAWLFNHSETLTAAASGPLPESLAPLPDAPERAIQFKSLLDGKRDPLGMERAAIALMRPDPLAPVFGERLRAIAKRSGKSFIARLPDRPLLNLLEAPANEALAGLRDYATLRFEGNWLVATPRDPLSTEARRTSRLALFALAEAAQRDGALRNEALFAFSREVPRGVYHSLAYRYVRHFRNPIGLPRNASALAHLIASCSAGDLRVLTSDRPVATTGLSAGARKAVEHFIFDVPEQSFVTERWEDDQWSVVAFLEGAEPTSRIPGPVAGEVFAHMEIEPEWEIEGETFGSRVPISLDQLAESLRRPEKRFKRFYARSRTSYKLTIWVGDSWLESHPLTLTKSDFGEAGLVYEQLPAALRQKVEGILREREESQG